MAINKTIKRRRVLRRGIKVDLSPRAHNRPITEHNLNLILDLVEKKNISYPLHFKIKSTVLKGIQPEEFNIYSREHLIGTFTNNADNYSVEWEYEDMRNVWKNALVYISHAKTGGCTKATKSNTRIKSIGGQRVEIANIITNNNDCGVVCIKNLLNLNLKNHEIRHEFDIPYRAKLTPDQIIEIYDYYNATNKPLKIIESNHKEYINLEKFNYLYFHMGHYSNILKNLYIRSALKKNVHRTSLTFDFETRTLEKYDTIGESKAYYMKDTICGVCYGRPSQRKSFILVTNEEKSSARQFLDFLLEEALNNRYYKCNAYNGSRFDFYLLFSVMTDEEIIYSNFFNRGFSILEFKFYGHVFTDLSNFLIGSLDKCCNDYKIDKGKITETSYGSSRNLCFYKPELNFNQFMDLQNTEPEYWKEYTEYCIRDCEALYDLWKIFVNETNELIPIHLKSEISVDFSSTIGSFSKKFAKLLMGKKLESQIKKFIGFENGPVQLNKRYYFIRKCIRGGISYSIKCGPVNSTVVCVDITSQYPDAMMNMKVPIGYSKWVHEFSQEYYGFYHLSNVEFYDKSFKPVAQVKNNVLDWNIEKCDDLYIGSELLKYLIANNKIKKYTVVNGLVSKEFLYGSTFFGKYINGFFDEKQKQDTLKNTPDYNPAKRNVCKLFLNSLSGKLVEDPSRYKSLTFKKIGPSTKKLNGVPCKDYSYSSINSFVIFGICMYDYSKINLFNSVDAIGPQNILNAETDSLFFDKKYLKLLEDKPFFGNNLGQINIEGESDNAIFVNKKIYYFNENKSAFKGIKHFFMDKYGNMHAQYNRQTFIDKFEGKEIKVKQNFIHKNLFGDKTYLTAGVCEKRL